MLLEQEIPEMSIAKFGACLAAGASREEEVDATLLPVLCAHTGSSFGTEFEVVCVQMEKLLKRWEPSGFISKFGGAFHPSWVFHENKRDLYKPARTAFLQLVQVLAPLLDGIR